MGVNAMVPAQGIEQNSSKYVGDLPTAMWKCELCHQTDFYSPIDHVFQQHGVSWAEYIHLVRQETEKRAHIEDYQRSKQHSSKDNNKCDICQKGLFINEQYKETHMKTMHGNEVNKTANENEDIIGDPLANIKSFIHTKDDRELPVLYLPDD